VYDEMPISSFGVSNVENAGGAVNIVNVSTLASIAQPLRDS